MATTSSAAMDPLRFRCRTGSGCGVDAGEARVRAEASWRPASSQSAGHRCRRGLPQPTDLYDGRRASTRCRRTDRRDVADRSAGARGFHDAGAADHVFILHSADAQGPILPGQDASASVKRVDLRELNAGQLPATVALQDGDTVYVPPKLNVYVSGR